MPLEYMVAKLLKKKTENFTSFLDSVANGKTKPPDPQLKRQKVQRRASSPCTKGIIFRSATIHHVLKWQNQCTKSFPISFPSGNIRLIIFQVPALTDLERTRNWRRRLSEEKAAEVGG